MWSKLLLHHITPFGTTQDPKKRPGPFGSNWDLSAVVLPTKTWMGERPFIRPSFFLAAPVELGQGTQARESAFEPLTVTSWLLGRGGVNQQSKTQLETGPLKRPSLPAEGIKKTRPGSYAVPNGVAQFTDCSNVRNRDSLERGCVCNTE